MAAFFVCQVRVGASVARRFTGRVMRAFESGVSTVNTVGRSHDGLQNPASP